jgi:hypothetical protein
VIPSDPGIEQGKSRARARRGRRCAGILRCLLGVGRVWRACRARGAVGSKFVQLDRGPAGGAWQGAKTWGAGKGAATRSETIPPDSWLLGGHTSIRCAAMPIALPGDSLLISAVNRACRRGSHRTRWTRFKNRTTTSRCVPVPPRPRCWRVQGLAGCQARLPQSHAWSCGGLARGIVFRNHVLL